MCQIKISYFSSMYAQESMSSHTSDKSILLPQNLEQIHYHLLYLSLSYIFEQILHTQLKFLCLITVNSFLHQQPVAAKVL